MSKKVDWAKEKFDETEKLEALKGFTDDLFQTDKKDVNYVPLGMYEEEAEEFLKLWGKRQGFQTDIESIDALTYGMVEGELIILAGTPGIGKSALIANMAINFAKQGNLTTIINLEIPNEQLATRTAKAHGDKWAELPIMVQEQKDEMTTKKLVSSVRELVDGGCKIIFIDYLQLLATEGEEYKEISKTIKTLKQIAVNHKVVMLAISSLNRGREEGELDMRSLHGSGKIEFYADIIMFLDRDKETEEMFVKIVKNRNRKYDFQDNKRVLEFDGSKFRSPQRSTTEKAGDKEIIAQVKELFPDSPQYRD